jgi:hypothetical protein
MDEAFNALFQFDERAVIGHADDASVNVRAHRVAVFGVEPGVGRQLFETERDALFVFVILKDLDLNLVADIDKVARVRQTPPRHVGDVQQPVDPAHINKRTILRQVLDDAGKDGAFFQMLKRLATLFGLLFFEKLLARNDDIAALLVQLDNGDFNGLALHAVEIANRPQIDLGTGQEGAGSVDVHSQATLDAFDDDAFYERARYRPRRASAAPSGAKVWGNRLRFRPSRA